MMKFPWQGKEYDEFDRAACGILNKNTTACRGALDVSYNVPVSRAQPPGTALDAVIFQVELANVVTGKAS